MADGTCDEEGVAKRKAYCLPSSFKSDFSGTILGNGQIRQDLLAGSS